MFTARNTARDLDGFRGEAGFVVAGLVAELAGGDAGAGRSIGSDFEIRGHFEIAREDRQGLFRKLVLFLYGLGIDHLAAFQSAGGFPRQLQRDQILLIRRIAVDVKAGVDDERDFRLHGRAALAGDLRPAADF